MRKALNLAELASERLIEIADVELADASTLIAVELEMIGQLEPYLTDPKAQRQHAVGVLGYDVEPGTGDLHDFIERRLVSEYLLSMGVDVLVVPMAKGSPLYSHVARDASIVAVPGDIAPEAVVERLTTCPRLLLYGMDGEGATLRGTLFRRLVSPSAAGWPRSVSVGAASDAEQAGRDLVALVRRLEEGAPLPSVRAAAATVSPVPARATPVRRRTRHIPLRDSE